MGIALTRMEKMERDGYLEKPRPPLCPVCGAETDTLLRAPGGIAGCMECVKFEDAWEVLNHD